MASKNDKTKNEPVFVKEDAAKFDNADAAIEELRIALAKLGLKVIEDIIYKRVSKPEDTYNALVALYNAIKK